MLLSTVNCTVPVGVVVDGATDETVLVNATCCPYADGFTPDTRIVVVLAWFTVCVSVSLELDTKCELPEYCAMML